MAASMVEGISVLIVSFINAWSKDPPAGLTPIHIPRPPGLVAGARAVGDPVPTVTAAAPEGPRRQSTPDEIVAFLGNTGGSLRVDPAT